MSSERYLSSQEAVDRTVERLLAKTAGDSMWSGLTEEQRRVALQLAVREVYTDRFPPESTIRLADLPADVREALDQPTRRAHGPVDRVDKEVPRV